MVQTIPNCVFCGDSDIKNIIYYQDYSVEKNKIMNIKKTICTKCGYEEREESFTTILYKNDNSYELLY